MVIDGTVIIKSEKLCAEISSRGAELIRLRDGDGRDLLWDGNAQWWTGRAPLLFPIVGRLPNDTALIGGKNFSMRQHGFARAKRFSLVEKQNFKCCFRLEADDETREQYPFDFSLDATFTIEGPVLHVAACILNQSSRAMPVSFGFHPGGRSLTAATGTITIFDLKRKNMPPFGARSTGCSTPRRLQRFSRGASCASATRCSSPAR